MVYVLKSIENPENIITMDYSNSISQVRFTAMSMCKGKDRIVVGEGYTVYGPNNYRKTYLDKRMGEVYISNSKFMWRSFRRYDSYELTKSGNIKRK